MIVKLQWSNLSFARFIQLFNNQKKDGTENETNFKNIITLTLQSFIRNRKSVPLRLITLNEDLNNKKLVHIIGEK